MTAYPSILPGARAVENKVLSIFLGWLSRLESEKLSILELGCGVGNYSRALAERGHSVTSVDIDYDSLAFLKKNDRSGNCDAICADVTTPVLRGEQRYDIIIASEVLEHVKEPDVVLEMMSRLLRQRGWIFITIPNGFGPWEVFNRLHSRPWLFRILYFPFYWPLYMRNYFLPSRKRGIAHPSNEKYGCTLNRTSPHLQFWTLGQFRHLLEEKHLQAVRTLNTSLSYIWLPFYHRFKCRALDNLDIRIADFLPHMMVSGWILKVQKI
jgi:SAM-dependent methyltransferase